jgi:predicted PurR-regulated permease PerM
MKPLLENAKINKALAVTSLIIFGALLVFLLSDFINAFLGAVIFYLLFKSFLVYLVEKKNWKPSLAATVIILLSFLIVLLPVLSTAFMVYSKVSAVASNPESVLALFENLNTKVKNLTGEELLNKERISSIQQSAAGLITGFISTAFSIIAQIGIMYFLLYYLLINYNKTELSLSKILPISARNSLMLYHELQTMTFSNAITVPLLAIIQGLCAWLGFWFFGVDEPFFWSIMLALFSIIPLVGTAIIWVPVGLFLIASAETWQGVGVLVYSAVIITNIDNVFRFIIQKKFAEVHPIITVLGVIIGLNLFGLPGLIFGPLLISYFLIFVKMYQNEYADNDDSSPTIEIAKTP